MLKDTAACTASKIKGDSNLNFNKCEDSAVTFSFHTFVCSWIKETI